MHPGGPFWAGKEDHAWSIPKGEFTGTEDALETARREFAEETGAPAPPGPYLPLEPQRQANGKLVHAWAVEGEFDPATLVSNTCVIEWPPKSGRVIEIPEVDRAGWFAIEAAARKMFKGQAPFLDQLLRLVHHA